MIGRGKSGEDAAVKHLQKLGYIILERNFYCKLGEIDIIARYKEYLVFIEVKLRKNNRFGGAAVAVDRFKQQKIKRTAALYLQKNDIEPPVRFDVVLITTADDRIKKENIEVIEDAFR